MRKVALLSLSLLLVATLASAELQNVQVGGSLRIKGHWIMNMVETPMGSLGVRWGAGVVPRRPVGDILSGVPALNGIGVASPLAWGTGSKNWFFGGRPANNDVKFVESRATVNVKADFTDEVSTFIELDGHDTWGQDFRSNWVTGADARANSVDDVEVYQAYIEASEMWGMPLRARIGRQELKLGGGWLVGPGDSHPIITAISFDGIRLTYATDMFSVDAFATKLAENGNAEQDGDIDFYGIYGSYLGLENIKLDAYWLWLRDARSLQDTQRGWLGEWHEDLFGIDDYDTTNLHTVGLRGAGAIDAFDFEAEVAYQFGDAGQQGFVFKPWIYGDDGAEFGEWAGKLTLGYTFDIAWQPRVFIAGEYYGGEDNRDVTFWEWLWKSSVQPESSVSFNRLFADQCCSGYLDLNNDFSNAWTARVGVMAHPTESILAYLHVAYYQALESFESPIYWEITGYRFPLAPFWSFLSQENSDDLGWETHLWAKYNYTEDLSFIVGWAHLFTGDGLYEGNYTLGNGLIFNGGRDKEDADYVYAETNIRF